MRLTNTSGFFLFMPVGRDFPISPPTHFPPGWLTCFLYLPPREPDSNAIRILFSLFFKAYLCICAYPLLYKLLEGRDFCLVYNCSSSPMHKNMFRDAKATDLRKGHTFSIKCYQDPFQKSIKKNEMDKIDKLEGSVFILQGDSSERFIKQHL